jgi:hypothetical protein
VANVVPSLSMEHQSHIPQIVRRNPPTATAETIAERAWPQIDGNFWRIMRSDYYNESTPDQYVCHHHRHVCKLRFSFDQSLCVPILECRTTNALY